MTPTDTTKAGKSFAQLRAVWQSGLPRAQKAVLAILVAYARLDLSVYHSEAELAWESEYTVPAVRAALARLLAQGVLTVRQKSRQHYATEYQIHLDKLKTRAPYLRRRQRQPDPDGGRNQVQGENSLPSDGEIAMSQRENDLPSGESQRVNHFPQRANDSPPRSIRETTTEEHFSAGREPTLGKKSGSSSQSRPRTQIPAPIQTPAPEELSITDDLQAWWDAKFPGLDLPRAIEQFLLYARAKGYTNVDWNAAFRFYVLNGDNLQARRSGQRPGVMADRIVTGLRHQPRLEVSSTPEPLPDGEQAWRRMGPHHGWHNECQTIHQFLGSCPQFRHQESPLSPNYGPTPEHSVAVLCQIEAEAHRKEHGLSGLREILTAVVSSGNGHGHPPDT
jgi:hypothetical protein